LYVVMNCTNAAGA